MQYTTPFMTYQKKHNAMRSCENIYILVHLQLEKSLLDPYILSFTTEKKAKK
jgi:hypothetical protein